MPFVSRLRLFRLLRPAWLGTLRRLTPISQEGGEDRGTPVDRYYVERFLQTHRGDIRGRVLEARDAGYTRRYGGEVASCWDTPPGSSVRAESCSPPSLR